MQVKSMTYITIDHQNYIKLFWNRVTNSLRYLHRKYLLTGLSTVPFEAIYAGLQ